MFDELNFLGTKRKSIALATRQGSNIENEQALPPEQEALDAYEKHCLKYTNWSERVGATGIYNCFGMVWANRRTAIYELKDVAKILDEDEYRELLDGEEPVIGDIAVYKTDDQIDHVGIVVDFRRVFGFGAKIPVILSKLCDWGGEIFHLQGDLPGCKFDHFVTERPK